MSEDLSDLRRRMLARRRRSWSRSRAVSSSQRANLEQSAPDWGIWLPSRLASLCSPLFDPGRRPWVVGRDAPRPDPSGAPRRAAEGKGGAAWRRDRSHAQPRTAPGFGREHGEHGEDPPLVRSEHRGTCPQARAVFGSLSTFAHSAKFNFIEFQFQELASY